MFLKNYSLGWIEMVKKKNIFYKEFIFENIVFVVEFKINNILVNIKKKFRIFIIFWGKNSMFIKLEWIFG